MTALSDSDPSKWAAQGACRHADPDLFFPVAPSGPAAAQLAQAKEVCRRCQVRGQCLEYALETGQDFGVWGGMSEDERRVLRRKRRRHQHTAARRR